MLTRRGGTLRFAVPLRKPDLHGVAVASPAIGIGANTTLSRS
jgi:hypothetical protein